MLIFASLGPSTTQGTVAGTTRSIMLDSSPKGLRRAASGTRSQTEVSKAAEARPRQSDYFVATISALM